MDTKLKTKLLIRVRRTEGKAAGERRFEKPIWEDTKKGSKLKPGWAKLKDGTEEHHPKAQYVIRFWENGKLKHQAVASNPDVAISKLRRRGLELAAKKGGVKVIEEKDEARRNFRDAIDEYILQSRSLKKHKTYLAYKRSVELYGGSADGKVKGTCHKSSLEDLDRKDVLEFIAAQKASGRSQRTVANRTENLKTFYLHHDLPWPLKSKDIPTYTEKLVRVYDQQQIKAILDSGTQDEKELVYFFLCSSGREKDVQFACFTNINYATKKFWIEEDTNIGYTPKDLEEAAIPLPDDLIEMLLDRQRRYPTSQFIFRPRTEIRTVICFGS